MALRASYVVAAVVAAACAAPLMACGASDPGSEAPRYVEAKRAKLADTTVYPAGCDGLDEPNAYACAEQRFWIAFRMNEERLAVYDLLARVLARFPEPSAFPDARAELLFRRGQLANALVTENKQDVQARLGEAQEDFRHSMRVKRNPKVPPWLQTIEIPFALFAGDRAKADAVFAQALKDVELFPVGNILSLSGVVLYMPLDTGMPAKMATLLDRWSCDGYEWCERNTYRAPFGIPGIDFLFAEAHARMGDATRARARLEDARAAPGFAEWPYRRVVDDALADVGAFTATFAAIPPSQPAWTASYGTSTYSCLLCHGAPGHRPGGGP